MIYKEIYKVQKLENAHEQHDGISRAGQGAERKRAMGSLIAPKDM